MSMSMFEFEAFKSHARLTFTSRPLAGSQAGQSTSRNNKATLSLFVGAQAGHCNRKQSEGRAEEPAHSGRRDSKFNRFAGPQRGGPGAELEVANVARARRWLPIIGDHWRCSKPANKLNQLGQLRQPLSCHNNNNNN